MKKIRIITPLLLIVSIAMFFASCSHDAATHIPKDAIAVMVLDGDELLKLTDIEFIKENPEYEDMMKELEKESEKSVELLEDVLKDPDASGILLTEKSYAFATIVDKEFVFGVIVPIDRDDLEENLEMIADEFNVPISAVMDDKDDITYMEPEEGMIFGWNDDVFMFVVAEESDDLFKLLEGYMNLDKKESIVSNKDFKKFHKNCVAMNIWFTSNVIDNMELDLDEIDEFEKLTGIDLSDNYGHMHLDIQKDEIIFTTKLRFNESIQDLDKKKLMDNIEKIVELFEDPISSGMDLFGNRNSDWDDDEWGDDDWGDEWEDGEDYEEMTDEDWEAFFEELEEEE